jgi:glycosyltransferase involved in cell wall biosynthesis
VLVATPFGIGGPGGIDRLMTALDAELRATRAGDKVAFAVTRGTGPLWTAMLPFSLAMARLLVRPDILHLNLAAGGSIVRKSLMAAFARRLGIPYVVHLHGSRFDAEWAVGRYRARIDPLLAGAARIIVLGRRSEALVAGRLPSVMDRVVVLPNGAPPARQPAEDGDRTRILFLGTLGGRKGVPLLLKALARVADLPGWHAVIAGDGEVAETRAEVDALGLGERVEVPGEVAPEPLLASANLLVLPSFNDVMPMAILEAMAHGLAVVATSVGEIADVVQDGETGLLVPAGDGDALAAALRRLILDPGLRRRLGAAGRVRHAEGFAIGPYARRLVALWREVVERTPRRVQTD